MYRQYCEIEPGTTARFLASPSVDHFFESIIEDQFLCRPENLPKYQTPQPPAVPVAPSQSEVRLPANPAVDD
jgi:hypothetical protein